MPNSLANLDVESALSRISSGTLSKEIAEEYGVTPQGLRKALAKHPAYHDAISQQARSIVEEATHYALKCDDPDRVAIARVRAETAFKYAKAIRPEEWGDRPLVQVNIVGNAEGILRDNASLLVAKLGGQIEQEPQDVVQDDDKPISD